jgi:hypothetical protein
LFDVGPSTISPAGPRAAHVVHHTAFSGNHVSQFAAAKDVPRKPISDYAANADAAGGAFMTVGK